MVLSILFYCLLEYIFLARGMLRSPEASAAEEINVQMNPHSLAQLESWEKLFEETDFYEASEDVLASTFQSARELVALLEEKPETKTSLNLPRWIRVIQSVQSLAYTDWDDGGDGELAEWSVRQWHDLRRTHPQNVAAEQGLGCAWLLKSQKTLARIYRREGSPSGSSTSSHGHLGVSRKISTDAEDNARINSEDYIEARTILRPSMEFFERAREYAQAQGLVSGKLLEQSAEAYMSFGNVSHPRNNELCYQKALKLLQQVSEIEDYEMDAYLKGFLEENIDYIE